MSWRNRDAEIKTLRQLVESCKEYRKLAEEHKTVATRLHRKDLEILLAALERAEGKTGPYPGVM